MTSVTSASAVFKSVQRFTVAIAPGSLTGTATITSVNTAKSWTNFLGYSNDDGNTPSATSVGVGVEFGRIALTNATTITATRGSQGGGTQPTITFSGEIVTWLL